MVVVARLPADCRACLEESVGLLLVLVLLRHLINSAQHLRWSDYYSIIPLSVLVVIVWMMNVSSRAVADVAVSRPLGALVSNHIILQVR